MRRKYIQKEVRENAAKVFRLGCWRYIRSVTLIAPALSLFHSFVTHLAMETQLVYQGPQSNLCIEALSTELFQDLSKGEYVQASVQHTPEGVDYGGITHANNSLSSCTQWSNVQDWETEVEYRIDHPRGDVLAVETKSTGARLRTIDHKGAPFQARAGDGASAVIRRVVEMPATHVDFNTTRFSSVKIMRVKRFYYESERSSFVYRLVVQWEGVTKQEAEANGAKFKIYLETNHYAKMCAHPQGGCVSFMEKILDLLSGGQRREVTIRECSDLLFSA